MVREHYRVTGMTCAHCEQAVTRELMNVDGVSEVRVKLVPEGRSTVMVVSDNPVPVETVASAVAEAGYELADQAQPRRALPLAVSDGCACCA